MVPRQAKLFHCSLDLFYPLFLPFPLFVNVAICFCFLRFVEKHGTAILHKTATGWRFCTMAAALSLTNHREAKPNAGSPLPCYGAIEKLDTFGVESQVSNNCPCFDIIRWWNCSSHTVIRATQAHTPPAARATAVHSSQTAAARAPECYIRQRSGQPKLSHPGQ